VLVGGPSTYGWRSDWITGLLEYCRLRGCQVNVLSWHELTGSSIPAIEDHLDYAREELAESSAYAGLRIRELHVNEALIASDQYRPGELLGVMHYLEAGGADAAARTCWRALNGENNCYNDTLAGLLVPGTFEPRAAWWATKAYSDGVGSRVLSRFSDPHVVGIASATSDRPRSAQLLIAHTRGHRPPSARREGDLPQAAQSGLPARRAQAACRDRALSRLGKRPVGRPRTRRPAVVEIERGEATLTLHDVAQHEAYRLRLLEP